jgi:CRISPR type III-A-associated RAMP protein Csm4
MAGGLFLRLLPAGPWRIGGNSGARDEVDLLYHSDSVYAAVSDAMRQFGLLEEWLEATARNGAAPAVRFSSFFPCQEDVLFVAPPRSLWPPPTTVKLRAKGARFVPLPLVGRLLRDEPIEESEWAVDAASQCLTPRDAVFRQGGPFRVNRRPAAAVDRLGGAALAHETACLEFRPGCGVWCVAEFFDDGAAGRWRSRVEGAFRLLGDSGFGGRRTQGWGRCELAEVRDVTLPSFVVPLPAASAPAEAAGAAETQPASPEPGYWLLSLFSAGATDSVDWGRGSYSLVSRGGRVESPAGWGAPKRLLRMVEEGSVLLASAPPVGAATDVAPEQFPHPVYRAGYAVAAPIPWRTAA